MADVSGLKIVLNLVDAVVVDGHVPPTHEGLWELLRLQDPALRLEDVWQDERRCRAAWKRLTAVLHPDRFQRGAGGTPDRWTRRFQDVSSFFDAAIQLPPPPPEEQEQEDESERESDEDEFAFPEPRRKKTRRSASIVTPPQRDNNAATTTKKNLKRSFHIEEHWPDLCVNMKQPVADPPLPGQDDDLDASQVAFGIAIKCIHAYGGIAHGRPIEQYLDLHFEIDLTEEPDVEGTLEQHGGSVVLESRDEIKAHLLHKGPVVSTSFELTRDFYDAILAEDRDDQVDSYSDAEAFSRDLIGACHPVVIVGWKFTAQGEAWLVRAIRGDRDIPISMGQLSMENQVIAPAHDFLDYAWQDERKMICSNFGSNGLYGMRPVVEIFLSPLEFTRLFQILDCSIKELSRDHTFIICDSNCRAHSRDAFVQDASWEHKTQRWLVKLKGLNGLPNEHEHEHEHDHENEHENDPGEEEAADDETEGLEEEGEGEGGNADCDDIISLSEDEY